jgi:hypothetical protein
MYSRHIGKAIFTFVTGASFYAHATSAATTAASAVLVSGAYRVTATAKLSGSPTLISGGLNLLRVDGAAPTVLGIMHDDGLNGDAAANDGIYTLLFSASSVAQMQLQASAAIRAQVHRLKSPTVTVPVVVPKLLSVAPNSGQQGQQNLSVTITGQNTHFSQGTTTANFGTGITVATLTINSATSATAVLNIAGAAALGSVNVIMTSGLEVATLTSGFTVNNGNLTGDVVTWHYDVSRTGLNPNETTLTPSNVNSSTFGKLAEFGVDGQIDGQILYLHQVNIPTVGLKNVVYFATENDSVYALDASSVTGSAATVLWKTSLAAAGETAATSLPCGGTPSGVMGTPVIDRSRNAIYVVAMSQNSTSNAVIQRLHALDLTTGAELFGGPTTITATSPGTGGNIQNGVVTFDSSYQHNRAALLESGNTIYTMWSGLDGDCGPYSPWAISYSADTLAQTAALDLAPDNTGGGMWMGGAGPASDSSGNVYTITGNGFGGSPEGGLPAGSYNNSMVKLSTSSGLSVGDYFTPDISTADNERDLDFGSVGPLLVDLVDNASTTHHLAMGGGKDGQFYVVDRDNMGQYNSGNDNIYQQFTLSGGLNFSTAVYFNGTVYVCPGGSKVDAFATSNARLVTPPSQSGNSFGGSGSVLSISSNGSTHGIVWAVDWTQTELFAYDATNIANPIYSSGGFNGLGGHFITPAVVDGRVYFGTGSSVVVFGLLP